MMRLQLPCCVLLAWAPVAAPAQGTASLLAAERALVAAAGQEGLAAALRASSIVRLCIDTQMDATRFECQQLLGERFHRVEQLCEWEMRLHDWTKVGDLQALAGTVRRTLPRRHPRPRCQAAGGR